MAKTRPPRRFGIGGELVPPGPNFSAQYAFLEAVQRVAPEAIQALSKIAADLPRSAPNSHAKWEQEAPLRAWCEQWGFTGVTTEHVRRDWLLTVARRTAAYLRDNAPNSPVQWVFAWSHRGIGGEFPAPPAWNPADETERDYRERVERYLETVKALATEAGWRPPDEKRELQHFEWLALYQVGRVEKHSLRKKFNVDEQTMWDALTKTADLIGLALRPGKRGRPTKSPV